MSTQISITPLFFESDPSGGINPELIRYLDLLSSIVTECFYVIDIRQMQLCYVSPHASFLCGHTVEEALESGFDFFSKIAHSSEFNLLKTMYKAVAWRLGNTAEKRDEIDFFCCTFKLQQKNGLPTKALPRMVYHRMKPLMTTGEPHYLICTVVTTVVKESGNLHMHCRDGLTYEEYCFMSHRWKQKRKDPLTGREKNILMLARQGKKIKEIADSINVGIKTLQNSLTGLYDKLNVKSMLEAVIIAGNKRMIFSPKPDMPKTEDIPVEASRKKIRGRLTAKRLRNIQLYLDKSQSINSIAKKFGVTEGAIRAAVNLGKLKKIVKFT